MITAKEANEIFLQNTNRNIQPPKDRVLECFDGEIKKAAQNGCHTIILTEKSFVGHEEFHDIDEYYLYEIICPVLKENGYHISYEEHFEGSDKHYRFEISWNLLNAV